MIGALLVLAGVIVALLVDRWRLCDQHAARERDLLAAALSPSAFTKYAEVVSGNAKPKEPVERDENRQAPVGL